MPPLSSPIEPPSAIEGSEPGSASSTSNWPSEPDLGSSVQVHMVGNTKVAGSQGLTNNGDDLTVQSADVIYGKDFSFNDVGPTSITIEDDTLTSATITSNAEDNRLMIKNPLDENHIERISIYLNQSKTATYAYDGEQVTITIPETSRAVISKGSKNITIEPNGAEATIKIDENAMVDDKGNRYANPRYTISGANLTYQNKDIMERLVTTGEATVSIDTEKGFGYLLLNGKIGIKPGDANKTVFKT